MGIAAVGTMRHRQTGLVLCFRIGAARLCFRIANAILSRSPSDVFFETMLLTASFTVTFSSTLPGQGEVYFGSGSGCLGLVEVATQDLHPGTTQHTVVVMGNDLPGTV